MEKLNRAQKCSILGPQNLGSRGALGPWGLPGSAPDFPSLWHPPHHLGQVPCDFQEDWPMFIFQGISDKGPSSTAPPGSWGWCTAGSSGHDLAHLLLVVLLQGDSAIHLLSSGEVHLGLGKVPYKFGGDHTNHWGSYPWGVCQGPRPLKSESGRMEQSPAQTVRGCWEELRAVPLPTPWALAGPGEKFKVLADGGRL